MVPCFGIMGAIGCGKDTTAQYLIDTHGFKKVSFAKKVKDIAAVSFGWDRALLEGNTPESRHWRDLEDPFWKITPRSALQKIGTEMFRTQVSDDFWIKCAQKEIEDSNVPVVIADCRFENEIEFIHSIGGKVIYIQRDSAETKVPDWVKRVAMNPKQPGARDILEASGVHESDWSMYGLIARADYTVSNNTTVEDLYATMNTTINLGIY